MYLFAVKTEGAGPLVPWVYVYASSWNTKWEGEDGREREQTGRLAERQLCGQTDRNSLGEWEGWQRRKKWRKDRRKMEEGLRENPQTYPLAQSVPGCVNIGNTGFQVGEILNLSCSVYAQLKSMGDWCMNQSLICTISVRQKALHPNSVLVCLCRYCSRHSLNEAVRIALNHSMTFINEHHLSVVRHVPFRRTHCMINILFCFYF